MSNSTINRVLKNSGYLYTSMAFSMFVSLYSTRLILNALGESDFGIFCIIGGAIGMLGFLSSAMTQATQRFINYAEGAQQTNRKKQIFTVSIALHFLLSFIMIIILEIAGVIFFNGVLNIPADRIESAKWIYQFMILSTALTIQSVPYSSIINAHENMLYYSVLGFIQTCLKLIIAITIVYYSADKLILYGLLMTLLSFAVLLTQRFYCHYHYEECEFNIQKHFNKSLMREITSYASWGLLGSSSSMFSQYGMGLVLNFFGGTILNASQGIANQVSGQLMVFSRTMLQAINPVIGKKAGEGNKSNLMKAALMSSKLSFIIFAFFAFHFYIEAPYIMKIWLKNVPEWAVVFLRFEIIRNLIQQLLVTLDSAVQAEGHIKYYNILRSITFFLPLPITILLLWLGFSPYWYYIIWIISWNLLGGSIILYFSHKNCNLQYCFFFKYLFFPFLVVSILTFIIGFILNILITESLLRLIIVSIGTLLVYLLSIWFIVLNKEEKDITHSIFISIRNKVLSII